jgi:hypothetical protein
MPHVVIHLLPSYTQLSPLGVDTLVSHNLHQPALPPNTHFSIDVSVAEKSSPHRSPPLRQQKNQQHVCRISRSCAMDAGRPCPARHWYVCPIALSVSRHKHRSHPPASPMHAPVSLLHGLATESAMHRRHEPRACTWICTVSRCGPVVATPDSTHATVTRAIHTSQLRPAPRATLRRTKLTAPSGLP